MNRHHGRVSIPVLTRALAVTLGLILAAKAPAADPAPRPNVVVLIADDWSFPHAGVYGDKVVKTPNFDRVAREGVLFTRSYCAMSPSSSGASCRAAICSDRSCSLCSSDSRSAKAAPTSSCSV